MSHSDVAWMFELTVKDGYDAEFRRLAAEMAAATEKNEPGTLDYDWYVSEDGRRLHLFERYRDSEAALTHLGTFRDQYMARFFSVLAPERLTLYGAPNAAVRDALSQLSPPVMLRAAGLSHRRPAPK